MRFHHDGFATGAPVVEEIPAVPACPDKGLIAPVETAAPSDPGGFVLENGLRRLNIDGGFCVGLIDGVVPELPERPEKGFVRLHNDGFAGVTPPIVDEGGLVLENGFIRLSNDGDFVAGFKVEAGLDENGFSLLMKDGLAVAGEAPGPDNGVNLGVDDDLKGDENFDRNDGFEALPVPVPLDPLKPNNGVGAVCPNSTKTTSKKDK